MLYYYYSGANQVFILNSEMSVFISDFSRNILDFRKLFFIFFQMKFVGQRVVKNLFRDPRAFFSQVRKLFYYFILFRVSHLVLVWYFLSCCTSGSAEACWEPCQTSKMELFAKIVHSFYPLTIFAKCSILYV